MPHNHPDSVSAGVGDHEASTGDPQAGDARQTLPADELEERIDPRLDHLIGRSLEAHYEDIAAAPLPDAILVLLAQLEAKESSS
jgi:hypothetical protein